MHIPIFWTRSLLCADITLGLMGLGIDQKLSGTGGQWNRIRNSNKPPSLLTHFQTCKLSDPLAVLARMEWSPLQDKEKLNDTHFSSLRNRVTLPSISLTPPPNKFWSVPYMWAASKGVYANYYTNGAGTGIYSRVLLCLVVFQFIPEWNMNSDALILMCLLQEIVNTLGWAILTAYASRTLWMMCASRLVYIMMLMISKAGVHYDAADKLSLY